MKKFNTSDLFTGYLKQLLHNFNLPKIKVYTNKHRQYASKNPNGDESPEILGSKVATKTDLTGNSQSQNTINVRYFPYIKDGEIQEYIDNTWVNIGKFGNTRNYVYGEKILNYTKNLKINSNVYDSYTHEYLGDYLRFHRDYLGLDLMPLYNCFSNRSCDKLKLKWSLDSDTSVSFDTLDANFKIYMVPVKMFSTYTIAIDSEYPIEMCCGIYGDYQDKRAKFGRIPNVTYKRVSSSIFSQPFIYDLLAYTNDNKDNTLMEMLTDDEKIELAQNEMDLKLFIKVPVENNSSIVILEGNYLDWNSSMYAKESPKYYDIENYLTELPENITEADLNKLFIINKNNSFENLDLYTVISNDKSESKVELKNLGSIWGNNVKYSKNSGQFKLIIDDTEPTTNSNDPAVLTAYKEYSSNRIITKQFIAYYNTKLNKLYVPVRGFHKKTNKTVINLNNTNIKKLSYDEFPLITPLQLLHLNTKEHHPFADRLIEYLIGNAITNAEDEVYDNVRRAQKALASNFSANNYNINIPGIWSNEMRILFYEYMTTNKLTNNFEVNHDILGYVDKDVEKFYLATFNSYKTKDKIKIGLSNVELEEEDK